MARIVIVGAGLAGLSTAVYLQRAGHQPLVLERGAAVGGRVATDRVEGFLLDRGFQVLLASYPEVRALLDLDRLDLRPFRSGARVRRDDGWVTIIDPLREPTGLFATMQAGAFRAGDFWRILRLRRETAAARDGEGEAAPQTTGAFLRERGFSERAVERFFRPFFSGVFLEPDLETPADFFRFVFRMFATGPATLPAGGMGAIPAQLAAQIAEPSLRLDTPVREVHADGVTLEDGQTVAADAVVVATDCDAASQLLGLDGGTTAWRGCTTLHFAAPEAPFPEAMLVLGGGRGGINSVVVPSNVAPDYAPPGMALVSATLLGVPEQPDAELVASVQRELRGWFGSAADAWRPLRIIRVPRALPTRLGEAAHHRLLEAAAVRGLHLAGDYLVSPSIDGALLAGHRAATRVQAALRVTTPA